MTAMVFQIPVGRGAYRLKNEAGFFSTRDNFLYNDTTEGYFSETSLAPQRKRSGNVVTPNDNRSPVCMAHNKYRAGIF